MLPRPYRVQQLRQETSDTFTLELEPESGKAEGHRYSLLETRSDMDSALEQYRALLNAQEICKLTLHEMGHLGGLEHSTDPRDVMYSPFEADPIPPQCGNPL